MVVLLVPLMYDLVAIIVAIAPPAEARAAAARGSLKAQSDYFWYLASLYALLTVVPLIVIMAGYVAGLGPFAWLFWIIFAGPGMLAIVLRLVVEAARPAARLAVGCRT